MPLSSVGRDGDHVVEHRLDDVGRLVDDVGALGEHRRIVGVDDPLVDELARARLWATSQIDSARAAQCRSPILLTASFDAKNSAQTQNAGQPGDGDER